MRKITFLFLILFAQQVMSQSDEAYQKVVTQITEHYNAKNASSIYQLFSKELQSTFTEDMVKTFVSENHAKKGSIDDASFLMNDDTGYQFLVQFTEATSLFVLMLNADGKLTKFELSEY